MRPLVRRRAMPVIAAAWLATLATLVWLAVAPLPPAVGVPRPSAGAQAVPAATPVPDDQIGGPLMASQGTVVNYPDPGSPRVPDVPASSWVIANAGTGQVLAAEDPHGRFGPASTMKVLTAITLIPLLNPNGMVLATQQAADAEANDAGLIPGHQYKVSDLFTALLTISANDAAVALTQATGSFAKGMALINAEARHLQAYDVVAKQPNGLPAAGQVESAYDEALIARQALAMPAFMKYYSTLSAPFEIKPHDWETLVNQNWLLTKYPGALGGKIGWTVNSEATYIGMARRHGVTLIVTIMHCTPLQEITSAIQLLNWGFAMNGKLAPVGQLVPPLATTAAVHHGLSKAERQRQARLATSLAGAARGSTGQSIRYALLACVILLAGLCAGGLARRRRLSGRHRELGRIGRSATFAGCRAARAHRAWGPATGTPLSRCRCPNSTAPAAAAA